MTKSILKFSYLYIFLFFFTGLQAQILEPVKWSFSSEKVSDTEFDLIFKADIENKWHLYSQDIPMSPPATNFNFEEGSGYEFVGKTVEVSEVIEEYDPNFEMVLKFFAFEAVFKQRVKLTSQSPVTVKGFLEFMCCDDTKCLPPADVDFEFKLAPQQAATAVPTQGILEPVTWKVKTESNGDRIIDIFFTATIDDGFICIQLMCRKMALYPPILYLKTWKDLNW